MNRLTESADIAGGKRKSLTSWCLGRCRQLIEQVKEGLRMRFGPRLAGEKRILEQALNEAESLAFQTPFPQLFFPALAEEKVMAVNRWSRHQQGVRTRRTDVF